MLDEDTIQTEADAAEQLRVTAGGAAPSAPARPSEDEELAAKIAAIRFTNEELREMARRHPVPDERILHVADLPCDPA